jgi:hypothetical protein
LKKQFQSNSNPIRRVALLHFALSKDSAAMFTWQSYYALMRTIKLEQKSLFALIIPESS